MTDALIERLRAQGTRYHNLHPFHRRMDAGELTREELQRWVANRFYYQECIPLKDAAIMSNCTEVAIRRAWIQRIIDHDGTPESEGGIESWLRLGEALGVSREELESERGVLPGVRYAVDAYVNFARQSPWIEAVASSLTELFGPSAIKLKGLGGGIDQKPSLRHPIDQLADVVTEIGAFVAFGQDADDVVHRALTVA